MCSATASPDPDRTGRARIRDAALECFAASGVTGTSLKTIAAAAEVSAPLVIHHFGSKDGLRRACDEHVAATIRAQKLAAMADGPQMDPLAALRRSRKGPPVLRYLARTLGDGSPEVAELIDEMVDDAVEYMAEGVRTGLMRPSDQPRAQAVVLVLWSLGLLTLHEHLNRLLGVDITNDDGDVTPYILAAAEVMGKGVLAEGLYEQLRDAITSATTEKATGT